MKAKNRATAVIISLLIWAFVSSCSGDGIAEPTPTSVPATSTALPTKPPSSTPTGTPIPSPTLALTPTPVQGQFLNRPAYLQEIFSGDYWTKKDYSDGSLMLLPLQVIPSIRITFAFDPVPETADFLVFRTDLDLDPETRAEVEILIQNLIDSTLKNFLPSPAREDLWKFINAHPDPGSYNSRIYGFDIYFSNEDNTENNQHEWFLQINEKED